MKRMIYFLVMAVMTIAAGYSQVPIQNYEYEYDVTNCVYSEGSFQNETWRECYFFAPEVTVQNKKYLPFTNKDTNEAVALIRQEGRKAYVLITKEFLKRNRFGTIEEFVPSRIPEEGEELLIWDFESPVGESYEGLIQSEYYNFIGHCIVNIDITEFSQFYSEASQSNWNSREVAIKYKSDDVLNSNRIIEGLGALNSYLYVPFLGPTFDSPCGYYISLVSVKDRTDNYKVIYGDENNGVETVTPTTVQDYRMYDLMGREICNPEKGTVYIQNGRKFIAR